MLPSQELLIQLLRYDPQSGKLYWIRQDYYKFKTERLAKIWNTKYADKEAFTAYTKGYKCGRIQGKTYLAHRVIWKLIYGTEPDEIDHEDGVRSNNLLNNLRDGSNGENQNQKQRHDNTSNHAGVSWSERYQRWEAYINYPAGTRVHLGRYTSISDAIATRQSAEIQYGYHSNHGRK